MSSASAVLRTLDGEHVAHAVYSGTSDTLGPNLAETMDAAWGYEKGRAQRPDGRNAWDVLGDCDHEREVGYIWSHYGGGSWWPVEFCRECMVIHGPLAPHVVLEGSDAPDDWLGQWPKDGEPPIEGNATEIRALLGKSSC